jgi:hypothetical protein
MQPATVNKTTKGIGPILVVALAIVTSFAPAAAVNATPSDPSRVAMVFPPWWSAAHAVTAAASAGEILGVGGVPFVVIVHCDPKNAARRARSVGALFILGADARSLCSSARLDSKL